jgi:hypothetical protein
VFFKPQVKGTRKFSLWTPLQNFEIMVKSQIVRQVEILAVDSAAEFPPDNSYIVFIYGISLYIV